jgi:tripeptide aminopeptidase
MEGVLARFLRYVKFDTRSDGANESTVPSSEGQRVFAAALAAELQEIGLSEVTVSENAYVTALLPANVSGKPTIGFIGHLDTSPEISGANVQARVVHFDGSDIRLNDTFVLSPSAFPNLLNCVGEDLVVTDGTTLLGADDKAGIAEILTALEYLVKNPAVPHGAIRVAFTPDEEISHGAEFLDIAAFGADWAYTVDGGPMGDLEFETFNAAAATVTFHGRTVHPGYGKGIMRNAMLDAAAFVVALAPDEIPQKTEGYQGFFHLMKMSGSVETAVLRYIIRDHDAAKFQQRKETITELAARFEGAEVVIKDQYRNMREVIEPVMYIVDLAKEAIEAVGVKPNIVPIRGGTDGSSLSFRGLPCPDIFSGAQNEHGRYEFVTVKSMEKAAAVIVEIVKRAPDKK